MKFYLFPLLYIILAEAFNRLKACESWRGSQKSQEGFTKEDKEALNALLALTLAPIFKDRYGIPCCAGAMARRVLARVFRKAFMWDYKPNNIKVLKEAKPKFDEAAKEYVRKCIMDLGNDYRSSISYNNIEARVITEEDVKSIADWVCDVIMKYDNEDIVYAVAKHLATRIEFAEVKDNLRPDLVSEIREDLDEKLASFADYPVVREIAEGEGEYREMMELLEAYSWSRYTFRWQGYYTPVRCSILTHMLETSLLAYLMAYEKLLLTDSKEEKAEWGKMMGKGFKVGLYHDITEIWTDDVPSPAKDGLDIRKIVEDQERYMTETKIYARLPACVVSELRNGVMLEDAKGPEKDFYKAADYFSADLEVWWNVKAGARDHRFKKILYKSLEDKRRTLGARTAIRYFLAEIDDEKFFR